MGDFGVNLMCLFSSKSCILALPLSGFMCCIHILTNFSIFKLPYNNRIEVGRFLWRSSSPPLSQSKFNCIKLLRNVSGEVLKISKHGDPTVPLGNSFSIWSGSHGNFFSWADQNSPCQKFPVLMHRHFLIPSCTRKSWFLTSILLFSELSCFFMRSFLTRSNIKLSQAG